jgi:hypothetical protein
MDGIKEIEEKLKGASPEECSKLVKKIVKIKLYKRRKQ